MEQNPSNGRTSKTRSYLLYAVGEIFLVVIGILIALQVNNLNEERKSREFAVSKLDNLMTSYETFSRQPEANAFIRTDSLISSVLANDREVYRRNIVRDLKVMYQRIGLAYEWDESIYDVLEYKPEMPDDYLPVITLLERIISMHQQTLIPEFSRMQEMMDLNKDIMSKELPAYTSDDEQAEELVTEYYFNDPYFRNRLYHFQESSRNYIEQFVRYKMFARRALFRYKKIKTGSYNDTTVVSELINEWDIPNFSYLTAMPRVACSEEGAFDSVYSIPTWALIINFSSDSVAFGVNGRVYGFLAPNTETSPVSSTNRLFEIQDKEGNCQYKIRAINNGYYIIR